MQKAEPVYTPNIESLLDSLQGPLSVIHTVDPRDAETELHKVDAFHSQGDWCHRAHCPETASG